MVEDDLPKQPKRDGSGPVSSILPFGTLGNTGTTGKEETKSWGRGMMEVVANRLIASAFCSWYATGGSVLKVVPQVGFLCIWYISGPKGDVFCAIFPRLAFG